MKTATSPAGPCAEAGFTLLEVLVVLALLGLAASVIGTALPGARDRAVLSEASAQVESLIVSARTDARRSGQARTVLVDLNARRIGISERQEWQRLPPEAQIAVVAAREVGSVGKPAIVFLGDGTSSGGEVTITIGSSHVTRRVEWLTGRVRDEP